MDKATLAVEISKYFEKRLEALGARGTGLNEKACSVRNRLPSEVFQDLLWLARQRNLVVHETAPSWDEERFLRHALDVVARLGHTVPDMQHSKEPARTVTDRRSITAVSTSKDVQAPERVMNRIAAEQIIEMLKVNVLHLSDDEFEELHDEANAVVMTECNRLSEDWDAFQYLAAQKDRQAAERFHYFALALRAGAPIGQLMERVRDAIPMSFLVAEFRLSNVETGSGQTVG